MYFEIAAPAPPSPYSMYYRSARARMTKFSFFEKRCFHDLENFSATLQSLSKPSERTKPCFHDAPILNLRSRRPISQVGFMESNCASKQPLNLSRN